MRLFGVVYTLFGVLPQCLTVVVTSAAQLAHERWDSIEGVNELLFGVLASQGGRRASDVYRSLFGKHYK